MNEQTKKLLDEIWENAETTPGNRPVEDTFYSLCESHVAMHELTWKQVTAYFKTVGLGYQMA